VVRPWGVVGYRGRVTDNLSVDAETVLRLERHETDAHAIPRREVRDLGDALVLYDPDDPDPFWTRMVSVRWPDDPTAFDRRLTQALALFGVLGRRPHIWPSIAHGRPADLAERLEANGFRDVGGGHIMALGDRAACPPIAAADLGPGVSMRTIVRAADAEPGDVDAAAAVLAESFGAPPSRARELAADLRATLDDPRVALVLARIDGEPAAVAKATTFDGCSYLSSIGTRPAFRGRGLGAIVTREAVAAGLAGRADLVYLGVFSGNGPAYRLYERLGFRSLGESPDMLLEW
jgi:ribosomal protein S18 acetylase RimI-like enzyme